MCANLGLIPAPQEPSMVAHACNPGTQKAGGRRTAVQDQPKLHRAKGQLSMCESL